MGHCILRSLSDEGGGRDVKSGEEEGRRWERLGLVFVVRLYLFYINDICVKIYYLLFIFIFG